MLRFALIICLCLISTACKDQNKEPDKSSQSASSVPQSTASPKLASVSKEAIAKDKQSALILPEKWRVASELEELNTEAVLQLNSATSNASLLVFTLPKSDFENMSLEKLTDKDFAQLKASMKTVHHITGPNRKVINGMPAIQYTADFVSYDNITMQSVLVGVEGKYNYYELLFASLKSDFAGELPKFEQAVRGFRQVENVPIVDHKQVTEPIPIYVEEPIQE